MSHNDIPSWINATQTNDIAWSQPQGYKIKKDATELEELYRSGMITRVHDPYEQIVDDLYEYEHPDELDNDRRRTDFTNNMLHERYNYGTWFYFPWLQELVHYPEQEDHFNLRTSRNRQLITDKEQRRLKDTHIAVAGQSVGSNVVEAMAQAGVGSRYMLIDKDTIAPSNLNRIRASMGSVGILKTTHVGRRISQIDPYIQQVHLPEYTRDTVVDLEQFAPSVLVEEMDDIAMKYQARLDAQNLKIPLVMASDIGERAIIEIERYDSSVTTKPFHGRLPKNIEKKLANGDPLTNKEKTQSLIKVNGLRNLSPRLIHSGLRIGTELAGMPQLGTTATIGGALASIAVQEIFLDRQMPTGSYVTNTRQAIHGQHLTNMRQTLGIFNELRHSDK